MGKDTGQEQIQMQAEKECGCQTTAGVLEHQYAHMHVCVHTPLHTGRGDRASLPLRDIMKHL